MTTERWQELILGTLAILWGAVLMLPDDVFGNVQRYAALSKFLPDWLWGLLLIVCGLTLIFLRHLNLRKQAHGGLAFVWTFIVVLAFLGGFSIGTILVAAPFAALAFLHIFEYLRLSQLGKL